MGVDGFFAISGLLICRAWLNHPNLFPFVLARARRILPGLWVCLGVTAFLIVPLVSFVAGEPVPSSGAAWSYLHANAGVWVNQWDISGTPQGLTNSAWNGSLWTLVWECFCYLAVAVLGVLRILRPRVVLGIAVTFWSYSMALELLGVASEEGPTWQWMPQRAGLMFAVGAVLWCYRDQILVDGRLAAAAAAMIPLSVMLVGNYRVLAAPAVAYLCIFGALKLGRHPAAVLSNDVSYGVYIYAFPIQQSLLLLGLGRLPWIAFLALSAVSVAPVAIASWLLVERPVTRRRSERGTAASSARVAPPDAVDCTRS
jgi:peptidoglycan/LPS O-acetylase OafA/YrhL